MNPFVVDRLRSLLPFRRNGGTTIASKALTEMVHSGRQGVVQVMLPSTRHDFKQEVGDGLGSSVLSAPLNWLMRTFPEAPPVVEQFKNEEWQQRPEHALSQTLENPNDFYGGSTLWMATVLDFAMWGNAFWLKIRDDGGKLAQLWWVPRWTMEPKWPTDGKKYITHYVYNPGKTSDYIIDIDGFRGTYSTSEGKEIPVEDVVHFRFGLHPRNVREGFAPLTALWREIATDDQAANFVATVLRNLGVIGIFVSPKAGVEIKKKEEVERIKDYIEQHFSGDKRGEVLAVGAPTDVNAVQYNMQGFDVSPIRDVSEERVCATLGIPAAVVGFGTGLQQTKVGATMQELRRLAWSGCIIPMQKILAAEVKRSLIKEYEPSRPFRYRVNFDLSQVRALWEDVNEKHERVRKDVMAGLLTVKMGQQILGYPVDDDRDVYLQPINLIQMPDGTMGSVGTVGPQQQQGDGDANAED